MPDETTTALTIQPDKSIESVEPFQPAFHAVAVNATEMASATTGIKTWLRNKLYSIDQELTQLQEVHDSAVKHKWKASTFKGQLQRERQKRLYYEKLLAASEAGFTIVPNMPCDIFAIRVKKDSPSWEYDVGTSTSGYHSASPRVEDEKENRLPVGDGSYQNPAVKFTETQDKRKELRDGKEVEVYTVEQYCSGFDQIEFPLSIAHPLVMDATAAAMAMKIFDRVGVVPQTRRRGFRGDPIVLGQVTMRVGYDVKVASFLIAWYLDPRTL